MNTGGEDAKDYEEGRRVAEAKPRRRKIKETEKIERRLSLRQTIIPRSLRDLGMKVQKQVWSPGKEPTEKEKKAARSLGQKTPKKVLMTKEDLEEGEKDKGRGSPSQKRTPGVLRTLVKN